MKLPFILLACLILGAPAAVRPEQVIGSAESTFSIEAPPDTADVDAPGGVVKAPAQEAGRQDAPKQPVKWEVKEVKVIRVINRQGNNPLLPEEPVFNEDGKVVDQDGDDGDGDGDGGNGGGGGGAGKTAKYAVSNDGRMGEVTLLYDPATGFTDLRSGVVEGDSRGIHIFLFPADGQNPTRPWISISGVDMAYWDAAGYWERVAAGQTLVFNARHVPTGAVYQISVKVDVTLDGSVTIVGITKVGR